jgi:aspartate/methionine/tyrosine aminotransferase
MALNSYISSQNFQNPTGTTIPLSRRLKLIEIADHFGVPIIEDDPYGQLRFEGENIPSVVTLDSKMQAQNGGVYRKCVYLSTFSKIMAPGLRLAWVNAPKEVISKLVLAKQVLTCIQLPSIKLCLRSQPGMVLSTSMSRKLLKYIANAGMLCWNHWKKICPMVFNGQS